MIGQDHRADLAEGNSTRAMGTPLTMLLNEPQYSSERPSALRETQPCALPVATSSIASGQQRSAHHRQHQQGRHGTVTRCRAITAAENAL